MGRIGAIAALIVIAGLWLGVSYAYPPIGMFACLIHLVCAIFDMMMNGARYAEFAGMNLAGCCLAGGGAWLGLPSL